MIDGHRSTKIIVGCRKYWVWSCGGFDLQQLVVNLSKHQTTSVDLMFDQETMVGGIKPLMTPYEDILVLGYRIQWI